MFRYKSCREANIIRYRVFDCLIRKIRGSQKFICGETQQDPCVKPHITLLTALFIYFLFVVMQNVPALSKTIFSLFFLFVLRVSCSSMCLIFYGPFCHGALKLNLSVHCLQHFSLNITSIYITNILLINVNNSIIRGGISEFMC